MLKRLTVFLTVVFLFAGLSAVPAFAQDNETLFGVRGNSYKCFFYNYFDVFDSTITFDETIRLSFSNFDGNGTYLPVATGFTGIYVSVDETIGDYTGDISIYINGFTFGPFMYGYGIMVLEYSLLSPFVFYGMKTGELYE